VSLPAQRREHVSKDELTGFRVRSGGLACIQMRNCYVVHTNAIAALLRIAEPCLARSAPSLLAGLSLSALHSRQWWLQQTLAAPATHNC
jgi:hypothetical protein